MDKFGIEPPAGLLEKTLSRIHKEERILFAKKIILLSGIILFAAGFMPWLATPRSGNSQNSAFLLKNVEPLNNQSILVLDEQAKSASSQYGRNPYKYSIITTGK